MGAIRVTSAAIVLLCAIAAAAECVTDARQVSSRSANPNLIVGPSSWSGIGLAVAKSEAADRRAIWVAIYDEMLNTISGDTRVVTNAADADALIDLVWNGFEYGLFYRGDTTLLLQRLTVSGEPIGGPIAVDPTRGVRFNQPNQVAWNEQLQAWVLARQIANGAKRGLWVVLLERDGGLREEHFIGSLPAQESHLEVAVADSGIIGLLNVSDDGQVLDYTRVVTGNLFPETTTIAPNGAHAQMTAFGDRFVVVREVSNAIRWMVVDTDGKVLKADALLVTADGLELQPLAITTGNGEIALTYGVRSTSSDEVDFRLLRFTIDGTILSDTFFTVAQLSARFAVSDYPAQWSGSSWLIAATRDTAASGDSWIARYCPLLVQITGSHTARVGEPITLGSVVSGGIPAYEYQWSFSRNPGGPSRNPTVTRTFTSVGPSLATLTITDRSGEVEQAQFLINVTNEPDVEPEPVKKKRRSVRK